MVIRFYAGGAIGAVVVVGCMVLVLLVGGTLETIRVLLVLLVLLVVIAILSTQLGLFPRFMRHWFPRSLSLACSLV